MAIWAFDFDGTLCEDRFPEIGPAKLQAIEKAKSIKAEGNIIILWTCRVNERLAEAVEFCRGYGLEFDYVNENVPENIENTEMTAERYMRIIMWTIGRKT